MTNTGVSRSIFEIEKKQIFKNMEDKERTNESIRQKILDFMEKVFNKFLVKMPSDKKEELDAFMGEEKNLYNEDGSLTEEYKKKIKEMENYCKENPIEGILYEECEDEIDKAVIEGIIEFSDRRRELMAKYEEAERKEKGNFDPVYWAKQQLKESVSEEEYKDKLECLHKILEEDTIDTLDNDEELNDYLKDILKKGGVKNE